MRRYFARLAVYTGLVLCGALAGCGGPGDELPREAISGKVSLDGQPLATGVIQFRPTSSEPVPAGAHIKDGAFSIPRNEGLTPGNYKVVINAAGDAKALSSAESSGEKAIKRGGLAPELIPAQYNSNSTLTAKVEAGKDNTFEFALSSKPVKSK
jgi:hypothetical protein